MSEHDGGGGLAGGDITLTQPLNHSKKQKRPLQKGAIMNHPEFRPVIIYDDAVYIIMN